MYHMSAYNRNCVTTFEVPSIDRANGLKKLPQLRLLCTWPLLTCRGTEGLWCLMFYQLCLRSSCCLLKCDTVVRWLRAGGGTKFSEINIVATRRFFP